MSIKTQKYYINIPQNIWIWQHQAQLHDLFCQSQLDSRWYTSLHSNEVQHLTTIFGVAAYRIAASHEIDSCLPTFRGSACTSNLPDYLLSPVGLKIRQINKRSLHLFDLIFACSSARCTHFSISSWSLMLITSWYRWSPSTLRHTSEESGSIFRSLDYTGPGTWAASWQSDERPRIHSKKTR